MSFLANLRQQNAPKQTLKLLYFIDLATDAIHLSLAVGELHNGYPSRDCKPYAIQVQHLELPPAFMDIADTAILRYLCENEREKPAHWLNTDSGCLNTVDNQGLFQQIIDTQRAFSWPNRGRASITHKLSLDRKSQHIQLHWHINEKGNQRLDWQGASGQKVIKFHPSDVEIPFIWHTLTPQHLSIQPAVHRYSQDAIAAARASISTTLTPNAIQTFLTQHEKTWQRLQLPLPQPMRQKSVKSKLQAVLHCYSVATPQNAQPYTHDYVRLLFRYTSKRYCITLQPGSTDDTALHFWDGKSVSTLERNPEKEDDDIKTLASYIHAQLPDFTPSTETNLVEWQAKTIKGWIELLLRHRGTLENKGFDIHVDTHFQHQFVEVEHCRAQISRQSNNDLQLSLEFDLNGTKVPLNEILRQISAFNTQSNDGEFIHLDDGRILVFARDNLIRLSEEFGDLLWHDQKTIQLPQNQINRLKKLAQYLPKDTQWQDSEQLVTRALNIHNSPVVLDTEFNYVNATLRPYQQLGLCWLQHLSECGVNGLLADDMGLGKTLQTLAFLAFKKTQGQLDKPALIVLPTSLLHNWSREIEKFVPSLNYCIMHGVQRHALWQTLPKTDIVLSSYALITNDCEHWQKIELSWLILDEAQAIKNPHTQTSQAIRKIPSDNRLCLTGTPVENHLGELWSIFDFLMPGCLGDKQSFNRQYRNPIEKHGDGQRMAQLLERIAPFILRRSKDQVAKHLPPKTITLQTIQLNECQQQFYEDYKNNIRESIQQQLDDVTNQGQQHILLLSALLKLRQICCDPALVGEAEIPSTKREFCLNMIQELVEENRSLLLFSQFTSMLDILAQELDKRHIKYLMLTGKTRNRQTIVDQFQNGEAPVFLISLKAGGVGLNLTRADTVIHYDPWWNDAAERQATDRAHRIGQHKPVFVYKLIAEGTIEEKIARLQEYKSALSQQISLQAQASGKTLALDIEDLLALINE